MPEDREYKDLQICCVPSVFDLENIQVIFATDTNQETVCRW